MYLQIFMYWTYRLIDYPWHRTKLIQGIKSWVHLLNRSLLEEMPLLCSLMRKPVNINHANHSHSTYLDHASVERQIRKRPKVKAILILPQKWC